MRLAFLPTFLLGAHFAAAQCQPTWVAGTGTPGVGQWGTAPGAVYAHTEWDPDGAGPAAPLHVIAGAFASVGATAAANIAAIDLATGAVLTFGSGTDGAVRGLAVAANGDLLAVGQFAQAGGGEARFIARWDGVSWSALGAGLPTWGDSVIGLPNGDVLAGGAFSGAGQQLSLIRRWDGSSWSATSYPGIASPSVTVKQMSFLQNGDLVAVGTLGVKRLVGASWVDIGTNLSRVEALVELPNGDLVAGGDFTQPFAPSDRVARWDGSSWVAMGSGMDDTVASLALLPGGAVVAGGTFELADASAASYLAQWDGTSWSALGGGMSNDLTFGYPTGVYTLAVTGSGALLAAGVFRTAGTTIADSIASWDGAAWSALYPGTNGTIFDFARLPGGDLIAAGKFTMIGGVAANAIARFDGVTWSALGSGLDDQCNAVVVASNGDLIAGGWFDHAGGTPAARIARWDGAAWSAVGSGMDGNVDALAILPGGDLVAAGSFLDAGGSGAGRIARWNGSAWSGIGNPNGGVQALLVTSTGDLIAGGFFTTGIGSNHIARYDGAAWSPIGGGLGPIVLALAERANGDLVAGGAFPFQDNRVFRWDGASWSALGGALPHRVHDLQAMPNGDVVAGGRFASAGGNAASSLARWDGSSWSDVTGGVRGEVWALALADSGVVSVGGEFPPSVGLPAGGAPSANFAQLATPCLASVQSYGSGCSSTVGLLSLTADSRPWVGTTFWSTATGFAPNTIALWELGLSTLAVPVAALHPAGGAGCTQWLSPLVLTTALPIGGSVRGSLVLPNTPSLAGVVIHNMVAGIELDLSSNISRIATTNGLTLTLGSL